MIEFTQRYRRSGSPLGARGDCDSDAVGLDFSDWEVRLHSEHIDLLSSNQEGLGRISLEGLQPVAQDTLLCCAEDHHCVDDYSLRKRLCHRCRIPLCKRCRLHLSANGMILEGFIDDNWQGYIRAWTYEIGLPRMEKTASTPYWFWLTLFSIGRRGEKGKRRRRHLSHDAMLVVG